MNERVHLKLKNKVVLAFNKRIASVNLNYVFRSIISPIISRADLNTWSETRLSVGCLDRALFGLNCAQMAPGEAESADLGVRG